MQPHCSLLRHDELWCLINSTFCYLDSRSPLATGGTKSGVGVKVGRSGIRDNRSRGPVHEFITERAVPDCRLSVVSAYFTTFAYDRLRMTLDSVGHMRFLFGEPRFLRDADNADLVPPAFSFDESGLRLTEQIRQRAERYHQCWWRRG